MKGEAIYSPVMLRHNDAFARKQLARAKFCRYTCTLSKNDDYMIRYKISGNSAANSTYEIH